MNASVIAIICTAVGSMFFGVAQMTGKQAADEMDAVKSCFYRFGIGIPICYAVSVVYTKQAWPDITVAQVAMTLVIGAMAWGVGALLFFIAGSRDSLHRVSTVGNSMSVWVVLLSVVFLDEKFFPALIVVLALLMAGVWLMSPEKKIDERIWKWGLPFAIAVSLIWATSIVLTKVYIPHIPKPTFVFIKLVAATLFHAAFYRNSPGKVTRRGMWLSVVSAVTLVGGDVLFMFGMNKLDAAIYMPIYTTTIPYGFLLSAFVLKEKPTARNWVGMILIFAAAAICGYFGAK